MMGVLRSTRRKTCGIRAEATHCLLLGIAVGSCVALSPASAAAQVPILNDTTYRVGMDIAAGDHYTPGPLAERECEWWIDTGDGQVAGWTITDAVITILPGDRTFRMSGCRPLVEWTP